MRGTRQSRPYAGLAVALAALVLAILAGCGGSTPTGSPGELPSVTLGGYVFGNTSNVMTHPDFTANPASPLWWGRGWGSFIGEEMTIAFADGGYIRQVKTLKMVVTIPGMNIMRFWFAQDNQGNIHYLRQLEGAGPAGLLGIAAGRPAWFWLPRPANTVAGLTWYEVVGGVKQRQDRIMSTTATWRGQTGLHVLREINDDNHDRVFSPSWTGPDGRHDVYFKPGKPLWGVQLDGAGGYTKRP